MTKAANRADLRSLSLEELGVLVERMGEKPFRARQLFRWIHHKGAASLDDMTDLPRAFRERLAGETRLTTLAVDTVQRSSDGTRKYRLRTEDGKFIEAVYMPEEPGPDAFDPEADEEDEPGRKRVRRTLCVSTQVGCAMGCGFCMTATMGLVRNLTPGEIADQVYRVNADLRDESGPEERALPATGRSRRAEAPIDPQRPLTNLVYMGMGEPLHNYVSVKRSLDLLLHPEGANFSHRHVTVSTSGLVPNIQRLGEETRVKLAVSLNATTDEQRAKLMPVDKKWNIAALIDACRKFPMKYGRRITFEYVLLKGVNDTDEDARRLADLLKGLPAKVNLIPYNENPGLGFGDPGAERVQAFRRILDQRGFAAMVRKNRGRDISAACGQLAVAGQKEAPIRLGIRA
ncbi:MAG TPA: 23S rRNA (adenine(2503)-C(2))-methyltransferase RlmN [Myxococcales bacterium]|jgi:23S rRNA (adenine2503-C2)-methyltransferase|nr:23S rRNA (adenine(2503)-C(2))-methyltransferase RlmN [Myxococcales bacterium]